MSNDLQNQQGEDRKKIKDELKWIKQKKLIQFKSTICKKSIQEFKTSLNNGGPKSKEILLS